MKVLTEAGRILNLGSPFFEDIVVDSDTKDGAAVYSVVARIMSPTGSMHTHYIKGGFADIPAARGFIKVMWDHMKRHLPEACFFDVSEH